MSEQKFDFQNIDLKLYLALRNICKDYLSLCEDAGGVMDSPPKEYVDAQLALAEFELSHGPLPNWAIARNWDYSLVAAAPAQGQQVGQEPAGEVHLRKGGGISLLHVDLAQPLPPGTKLYTAPQPAPAQDVAGLLEWAVDRWHAEVANRPLQNVHRRSLDDTWRQVILKLGGDTGLLCGPAHDALAAHDKQSGEKKS